MEQKYLNALTQAENISRQSRTTFKDALEKSGAIWVLEEPKRVAITVFQSGIIHVFVAKGEPHLFQEMLVEIRTRRNDTIRRVDTKVDGKVIPYRPR